MKNILLLLCLLITSLFSQSQIREKQLLNKSWSFVYGYEVDPKIWQVIDLPHTWNKDDAFNGNIRYYRGQGTYQKILFIEKKWQGKRLFIKFDGVNTVSNIFVNGKHIGEHRGGYTAFVFEITDDVKFGEENILQVRVSNALQLDVMPLVGDFNIYGGIYRDVNLLITDSICISPLDYASSGVYLVQKKVSKKTADINAKILVSNINDNTENIDVTVEVFDGNNKIISQRATKQCLKKSQSEVVIPIKLNNPRLWNGRKDPFMYKTVVSLYHHGNLVDQIEQPLGLRFFHVDSNEGFFLNGEHLQLHGVCRHQDRSELGNALQPENHEEDIEILKEMGANSIRLSHYPQSPYFYDLLDENGIITWSEIPFVGPGGYRDVGFVNQSSFMENGKQQLKEMIRQNFNRPSICFWGIFNELKLDGDNPIDYLKTLNSIVKLEDSTRVSTSASCVDESELNQISDLICWNKYFGWYGDDVKQIGKWADETHKNHPDYKIGISEYGAGASIYQHEEQLKQPVPNSNWHPEAWQAFYHEQNWKELNARSFIWGTFIWNLFDFGASHRNEGDKSGKNDKGLVTFDRKTKKDAYYFYKANWNQEPMLYIADRRYTKRSSKTTMIKIYSNLKEVELFVNDNSLGIKSPNETHIIYWENVMLQSNKNKIEIRGDDGRNRLTDSCVWKVI